MTLNAEVIASTPWNTKTKTQWAVHFGVSYATFHKFARENKIVCMNTRSTVANRTIQTPDGRVLELSQIDWSTKTAAQWAVELGSTDTTVRKWSEAFSKKCSDGRAARFGLVTDAQFESADWSLPDGKIAESLKISKARVSSARKRLNKPRSSTRPTSLIVRYPDLKPEIVPTLTLKQFCEKYDCASGTAVRYAKVNNVKFISGRRTSKYDWTKVDFAKSNLDISKELGCSGNLVALHRRKLAPNTVPANRSKRGNVDWAGIDWANMTNAQIAEQTGYRKAWVGQMRLRIAPGTGSRKAAAGGVATPAPTAPTPAPMTPTPMPV